MAAPGGRGLVALFKRGCHEIPEIMGSAFMALIGLSFAAYIINEKEFKYKPFYRRYKQEYVVFRDDDPRVAFIRKD